MFEIVIYYQDRVVRLFCATHESAIHRYLQAIVGLAETCEDWLVNVLEDNALLWEATS